MKYKLLPTLASLMFCLVFFTCSNGGSEPSDGDSSDSKSSSSDKNKPGEGDSSSSSGKNNNNSSSSLDDNLSSSDGEYSSGEYSSGGSSSSGKGNSNSSSSGKGNSSSSSDGEEVSSSSGNEPPAIVNYPTLKEGQNGVKNGWNSRYWDGCRVHCTLPQNAWVGTGYNENTKELPDEAFNMIAKTCNINNEEIEGYLWKEDWGKWFSYDNSCQENGPAYTCWDMAPIAVNDTLAYAFAATPGAQDECGKCFQIQFTGEWRGNEGRPGSAHQALKGKTLIVMSSNIGHDVSGGQFDILIPGGGLGAFDSFSGQLGISESDLGVRSGGLLSSCDQEGVRHWDSPVEASQACLRAKCQAVFGNKSKNLLDGCLWQADWYMAADNPLVLYKEVECPQYLINKYRVSVK